MSREDNSPEQVAATHVVLGQIAEILESTPGAVIAGGTVPYLLIPQTVEPHEGTVDIDIVLDLDQPGADEVRTLHEILEINLFQQDPKRPFRYSKGVLAGDRALEVLVEFLAGGEPPPNGLRLIRSEDIYVSIIKGIEVALHHPVEVTLHGPNNVRLSVASIPAFLTMKATALQTREERKKGKDAYDIVYCLRNYPGGSNLCAELSSGKCPIPSSRQACAS